MVDGDISAEVFSTEFNAIVVREELAASFNIVVKVPMIKDA